MKVLRANQIRLKQGIHAAFAAGARNVMGVMATGSGKTVTMASLATELPGRGIIQAHRAELVQQLSTALGENGVRHNIIASPKTIRNVVDWHMDAIGKSMYDPRARWSVASVDTVIRRSVDPVEWIMTDECFPAGTRIDGVPIESIRVGDVVRAYCENTGGIVSGKVAATMRNPAPASMVRVTVAHHVIECTKGHPFWTRRGWVAAANLEATDELYVDCAMHSVRDGICDVAGTPALSASQNGRGVLYPDVWVCQQNCKSQTKTVSKDDEVSHVSEHCVCAFRPSASSVLQQGLQQQVPSAGVEIDNGRHESEVRICQDVSEQPDVRPGRCGENASNAVGEGSRAENSRWQRATANACGSDADDDVCRSRVCATARRPDREGQVFGVAEPLQVGCCAYDPEGLYRGGWSESLCKGETGAGRKKGRVFDWRRLDSVEVFEWANSDHSGRSDEGRYVYNFEVETHHTYIAGGVVVHNCHHVLESNKWGRAIAMFPNARWVGMTATPTRADGKGLGRHHDGLVDAMVIGPGSAELTAEGYLVPYDVAAPTASDLDMSDVDVGASGEYNQMQAARAVKRSNKIVGDCVKHYQELASGRLAIGFAVDIDHAGKLADAFNAAGIPSALVTAKTSDEDRLSIMKRFRARELLVLWNVDLFGEGVDVPGVEVVITARPTASFSLYAQMIGRMLRLSISPILMAAWDTFTAVQRKQHIAESAKPRALLIDHVGNVYHTFKVGDHDYKGLPEGFTSWSLDRRGLRRIKPGEAIPVRKCGKCYMDFERVLDGCPFCGEPAPGPAQRNGPQHVDGNVFLLAPEVLARMRGEIVRPDATFYAPQGVTPEIARAAAWNHQQRANCQVALRDAIAHWAGKCAPGKSDGEISRLFYFTFGMDTLSALALGATPATKLKEMIDAKLVTVGA